MTSINTPITTTYKQKLTDQVYKCFPGITTRDAENVCAAHQLFIDAAIASVDLLLPEDQSKVNEHAARQMALALTHLELANDALNKALIFNAQK